MTIKRFLPKSLFGRSLLIIVSPLILLQVVSTWIFYDRHWQSVSGRLANAVAGDIAVSIELIREETDSTRRTIILQSLEPGFDITITFEPDAIIDPSDIKDPGDFFAATLTRAMKAKVRRPFHIAGGSFQTLTVIRVQLKDGVLRAVVPRNRLFTSTTYIFVIWMVGSSLVLFAVAGIFMRNQVRPIRRLAAAAESFGKGRDPETFHFGGATEVRQAAAAFRRMRDRIMRQVERRTQMLAGVSHDLRTPLTRMRLGLAMLPESAQSEGLREDIADMERMLDGYLAFARGEGDEATESVDLDLLLKQVATRFEREGKNVATIAPANLMIEVRPEAFKRCLTNLIQNAVRFGSGAAVAIERQENSVSITIDDDGPGIPKEERENVFQPFYRTDRSRNLATGGVGLGLSIAQDIVHAHGGTIELGDSPLGGLRVTLRIPI